MIEDTPLERWANRIRHDYTREELEGFTSLRRIWIGLGFLVAIRIQQRQIEKLRRREWQNKLRK